MIETLKDIGELYEKEVKFEEIVLDQPKNKKYILFIFIDLNKNAIIIDLNAYTKENWLKTVYKKDKSNTPNYTLTFELGLKEAIDKDGKNKKRLVLEWIKKYNNLLKNGNANAMCNFLKNNVNIVFQTIEAKINSLIVNGEIKKNERILVSIGFINNGKKFYVCDYYPINFVVEQFLEKMKNNKKGKCVLCGNNNVELFGKVLQSCGFQFYTINQIGFAPRFEKNSEYKRFPICEECAKKILIGKRIIDENLNFKLVEDNYYYVIPEVLTDNKKIRKDIYDIFIKNYSNKNDWGLLTKEDRIINSLKLLKNRNLIDLFQINILIYRRDNQRFIILSYLQGLNPVYLNDLANYSKELYNDFKNAFPKTKEKSISWWIDIIYNLSESSSFRGKFIHDILYKKHINEKLLIPYLVSYIKDLNNKEKIYRTKMFLELINFVNTGDKMDLLKNLNDDKKTCYAIGWLASYTAYIQEKESGKKIGEGSFRKKFNNLRLSKEKLKNILIECIEKLNQYEKPVPKKIKDFLVKDIENINLTNTEISYYFALGYALWGGEENDE